ncbi:VPLPA-CTERM sorting domain-containing protein [Jannaschia sp. LMIT008]|uniref:VPLPA-CTERM sorting domain-containing protein n=1 Tax=Jannaschia maritima TaxID=3032585 RepID=UPI002811CBE4|nr:VPLPA-CTERM sorting domain-containing protein [Jannaschia sp. LMIT008]
MKLNILSAILIAAFSVSVPAASAATVVIVSPDQPQSLDLIGRKMDIRLARDSYNDTDNVTGFAYHDGYFALSIEGIVSVNVGRSLDRFEPDLDDAYFFGSAGVAYERGTGYIYGSYASMTGSVHEGFTDEFTSVFGEDGEIEVSHQIWNPAGRNFSYYDAVSFSDLVSAMEDPRTRLTFTFSGNGLTEQYSLFRNDQGSLLLASMPLPAGAWLLIAGMGALGFATRYRRV